MGENRTENNDCSRCSLSSGYRDILLLSFRPSNYRTANLENQPIALPVLEVGTSTVIGLAIKAATLTEAGEPPALPFELSDESLEEKIAH